MEKATFAAGCFWGVEAAFRQIDGVTDALVGYTGNRPITIRGLCTGEAAGPTQTCDQRVLRLLRDRVSSSPRCRPIPSRPPSASASMTTVLAGRRPVSPIGRAAERSTSCPPPAAPQSGPPALPDEDAAESAGSPAAPALGQATASPWPSTGTAAVRPQRPAGYGSRPVRTALRLRPTAGAPPRLIVAHAPDEIDEPEGCEARRTIADRCVPGLRSHAGLP